jgi:hypothetical protein
MVRGAVTVFARTGKRHRFVTRARSIAPIDAEISQLTSSTAAHVVINAVSAEISQARFVSKGNVCARPNSRVRVDKTIAPMSK